MNFSIVRIKFTIAFVLIFFCLMPCMFFLSACSSNDMDFSKTSFSFLEDFDYGQANKSNSVAYFNTVEDLVQSTDQKLVEGCIVTTSGYYTTEDKGGPSYVLQKENTNGAILLNNNLYASLLPDKCKKKQKFDVINIKQFGAKAD